MTNPRVAVRLPTGEYRQLLHVFSLIEQRRPDNPGINMGEHYAYPWPIEDDKPDLGYIEAVYNMTRFQQWPRQWQSFWPELALCCGDTAAGDSLPGGSMAGFGERDPYAGSAYPGNHSVFRSPYYTRPPHQRGPAPHIASVRHGPYLLLAATLSAGHVAGRIVAIKRQTRRDLSALSGRSARTLAREHNGKMTPAPDMLDLFHDEITKRVLATFSPYAVNLKETFACALSTSSRSPPTSTEPDELSI
jgi:hypothetical protein